MVYGQASDSEAQVDLLDLPILDMHPRGVLIVGGGGEGARLGGLPTVQSGCKGLDNLVMVDGPCDGDHRVVRRVVGVEIVQELVPGDGVYRISGAADVPSQGVIGPDDLVEQDFSPLVGGVLDHVQFFENDASFFFDVLGVEAGVAEHVDEEVKGLGEVGEGNLGPVGGYLLVGAAVERATYTFDGLGYLLRQAPLLGPLKAKVLDEVGDARFVVGFVSGPGTH